MVDPGHHRRRSRSAHVGHAARREEEQGGSNQSGGQQQNQHVDHDPDHACCEIPGGRQNRREVRLRTDRREQQIERGVADLRCSRVLQAPHWRKGEQEPHGHDDENRPRGGADDDRRIADNRQHLPQFDPHHRTGEAEPQDHDRVPQVDRLPVAVESLEPLIGLLDRTRVRLDTGVEPVLPAAEEEQNAHPAVSDHRIDHDDRPENGIRRPDALGDRHHVRRSADPAPRQRGESHPGILGEHASEQEVDDRPSDHDSESAGQDHDQRDLAEASDPGDVDADHQEQQCDRQQEARHPLVGRRRGGNDAERGRQRGNEVGIDDRGGDLEHLPKCGYAAQPEDGSEHRDQIGEDHHRIGQERLVCSLSHGVSGSGKLPRKR